jgi:hypothetical protein
MTDLEKIREAYQLLQDVRDHYEPDPFPDLDSAIELVEKVQNQIDRSEELECEKRYQEALRYDFPETITVREQGFARELLRGRRCSSFDPHTKPAASPAAPINPFRRATPGSPLKKQRS